MMGYTLACTSALAATIGYDAEYRADYSDNALQSDSSEKKLEEFTNNYRLSFFGDLSAARARTHFVANLEFVDYRDDTSDDQALSSFIGSSEIALTSRTLSWVVVDALGYFDTDPGLKFNRRNQERVNYFLTGPKLQYAVGADTDIGAKLFYTNHNRDGRDEDYNQLNFATFWDQFLNVRDNWGIRLDHTLMLYQEEAERADYTITDLKTYFTRKAPSNVYNLSVGVSYLQTEEEETDSSGNFNAEWDHLFTRRMGLVLDSGYNLTDESVLNDTRIISSGEFKSNFERGLFYESQVAAKYYYKGVSNDLDFGVRGRALRYVDGPQLTQSLQNDHKTYTVFTNFRRFIGRSLELSLGLNAEKKDYKGDQFEETLYTTNAAIAYALTRNLDLNSRVEVLHGSGNLPSVDGRSGDRDYDEYIFSVGIHWDPYKSRRRTTDVGSFDLSVIN